MLYARYGVALAVVVSILPAAQAQDPPIEWGVIPRHHLTMRAFPADTNATAVVLADYGVVEVNPDWSLTFERHRRIKILTEAAYEEWGTFTLPYYAEDRTERVRKVRGQTFTIDDDGTVHRHKLSKNAIFKEDLDGSWEQLRFTLPALEPGAVIEYRYEMSIKSPVFFPSWTFQTSEPVLHSELRTRIPNTLAFVRATRGVLAFSEETSETYLIAGASGTREGTYTRWVMTNVEALREEPYMTTPKDYRASIEFQLVEFLDRTNQPVKYMGTWEDLAERLRDVPGFKQQYRPARAVRRQAEALVEGLQDPAEKLQAIYAFVASSVTWDGGYGIVPDREPKDVLNAKAGTGPEINALLVSMLRTVGLEAHPVLISTRDHGQIIDYFPLLSQFNYTVAGVDLGGQWIFLDATDAQRPYTLLPTRALNGRGWMVMEDANQWVDIEAGGTYKHQVFIEATVDETGRITGTFSASDGDYSALFKRHALNDTPSEDFVRKTMFGDPGALEIASFEIEHQQDLAEHLVTTAAFSLPMYAQAAGDFLYLNPVLVDRMTENPLRLPEREFPVDLTYPRDYTYTLRLNLPPGYEVQDVPRDVRMRMGAGGGFFMRGVEHVGGVLVIQMRFVLDRAIFKPSQYPELRQMHDRVVAAHAEQIVLKRSSKPAAPAASAETPADSSDAADQ